MVMVIIVQSNISVFTSFITNLDACDRQQILFSLPGMVK